MRPKNPVVVITGAANGIGAAAARRFGGEGARVVAMDRDSVGLERLAAEMAGLELHTFAIDVASEEECAGAAERIATDLGASDILINAVGVYPATPFEQMNFAEWRRIISVNLDSVFLATSKLLPLMKGRGWGRIINFASGTFFLGTPNFAHYAAAKAGVIGLSRCLAAELGTYGITVNVVSPGLTATETVLKTISPELLEARRLQRPLQRHGLADDVVGAIQFLSSSDADFITGQIINVDGGVVMH